MENKIKILFIGGLYPKNLEKEILKKCHGSLDMAANNCQWRFINGFILNKNISIFILNQMFIGSFPKRYDDWYIKEQKIDFPVGIKGINLGFINIAYIKHLLSPFNEKKYIKKWLIENKGNKKCVFIYSMNIRGLRISKYIKKISPETTIYIYIGDLIEHTMKEKKNKFFVKLWKKINSFLMEKGKKNIDGYIFVAKGQAKKMKISNDKYILIESLANSKNKKFIPLNNIIEKKIIYAGALCKEYGLENLIENFKKIEDKKARLIICGDGELKEKIKKIIKEDERIKYLGLLNERELENLFQNAWCFINPTENNQNFTNYSFPIKNIDYLLAGRPVICQKLEAIPDEYDKYFRYFNTKESLKECIDSVLKLTITEINEIGNKNFCFIMKNKTEQIQTKKIINFFNKNN